MIPSTVPVTDEGSLPSGGQAHQPLPASRRRQRRIGHGRAAAFGLLAAMLSTDGSASPSPFRFSTVALSGQPAPGTPAGITFLNFGIYPTLSAAGQSAFVAGVTGAGITVQNDTGLWTGAPGGVALLAREGNPAPDTAVGVNYAFLGDLLTHPPLNAAGQSAFVASITGTGITNANNGGVWSGGPGSVTLLARKEDPAPGTAAGITYFDFTNSSNVLSRPAINAAGQSAFSAKTTDTGVGATGSGLWSGASGSVALLARAGGPAPGTATGVNFGLFFGNPPLNAAGQSAFAASVAGPGVTVANSSGVWLGAPGSVTLLARGGDPAPGTTAGINYASVGSATLNSAGRSVFVASVIGPGVTSANDDGIWLGAPGSVALLARGGDHAPGTAAGVNYSGFFGQSITLNAAGRSAFVAQVTGPGVTNANDDGLWSGEPGSLVKVFYEGEAAPGAGANTFFGGFNGGTVDSPFALNDRGELVFLDHLTGSGVTGNTGSLWFSDAAGALSLIVRQGDPLQVGPGDMRIISSLSFEGGSGDEDGFPSGFNDLGQITFWAAFTDGSQGIFIATPAISIKIKTISKTGNTVTITLDSFTGYTFQLQRSLSLTPAAFGNIGSPQAGITGSVLTFPDPEATDDIAFYQVTAVP